MTEPIYDKGTNFRGTKAAWMFIERRWERAQMMAERWARGEDIWSGEPLMLGDPRPETTLPITMRTVTEIENHLVEIGTRGMQDEVTNGAEKRYERWRTAWRKKCREDMERERELR